MKDYVLTIVLPGKVTAAKKKSTLEKIAKIVTVSEGKVKETKETGVLPLAYEIAKSDTGLFINFELEFETSAVKPFTEKIKLEEGIIRYLLIRQEK